MDSKELKKLLDQEESATLEFKGEPYWIDHQDHKVKGRQRDELIKDVLALANGNSIIAGDRAYLIIGADNKKGADGIRALYDIGENQLTTRRILDIVNPACAPKLEDLDAEVVEIDGKRLNVITLSPSPHLFETTRRLEPSIAKRVFSEYVVFTRHNESIHVASGKERDAIAKLKRIRFNEIRNPPPEPFGALVGALIGATILGATAEKILEKKEGAQAGGVIAGTVFGGSVGFMLGGTFKEVVEMRKEWYRMKPERKPIAVFFSFMASLTTWVMVRKFLRITSKKTPQKSM